ncbi:MAG: hypothetical protein R3F56_18935 [Planctomycetota bacterium]
MSWAAALAAVVLFVVLADRFGVTPRVREVLAQNRAAVATIRDPNLAEADKEAAVRRHAGRLLTLFVSSTLRTAAALAVPLGGLWLLARAGVVDAAALLDLSLSWTFLAAATVVALLAAVALRRRRV